MKRFESLVPAGGVSRRAFLIAPFALVGVGVVALADRKEKRPSDGDKQETGGEVTVVLFSDKGERLEKVKVAKTVMSEAEWRKILSPEDFAVTRQAHTERALTGRYWDNHKSGLYRCVCCATALFRSNEKFESGTGWPSFWAPIAKENVREKSDLTLGMERVEVLCRKCDAHRGHL